ncbi:outer membrane beta-barrel family protein [Flavobacterium sp. '19STA2R22 D10 B1']|uniref:outer membrane beta-barrel family protein n=1 Tax=Flavobacterium aerium TaxID=3037261 RepID=UPI00278C6E95|nr:outer membrane beta-barrel family protein [Flavobacterium sp. '19STA2R22 D10 B1']
MKKYSILLFLISFVSFAQKVEITGQIKESSKEAVGYADIAILKVSDSLVIKNGMADENGSFKIKEIEMGDYILKVSAIGFADYYKNISLQQNQTVTVLLEQTVELLDHVVVTSKRPVIQRKIDRLEFNVENSMLSSNNAWEILTKTPGVNASGEGSIGIRGSKNILITINDKKVYLSGEELKQLLENTSGEDIKSVEVITNPPAKYEAQGSAVLNIKMKKNNISGYKGTVNTAYVQSMYPKGVISTSQYYKGKKLAVSGGYSFGTGTYYRSSVDVAQYSDQNGQTTSKWESILNRKNKSLSQNSYRYAADYEIDSLNTVSFGSNGFIALNNKGTYNVPTTIYNNNNQIDSSYVTRNDRRTPRRNSSYNATFEHKFNEKEKITLSSDYTDYFSNEIQDISSAFSLPGSDPYRTIRFVSDNTQKIKLFSGQVDYSREGNGTVEAGMKFGKVKANSTLDYNDEKNGVLVVNPERTNQFSYDESIYAGYFSYGKEIGKWSLKAGLRAEYTQLEGNSMTTAEVNEQKYFKVFPTLYAMYKPSDDHTIGLSYGKRISRPQYSWLNPFKSYYNLYSYFTGDPKLQPTITHNINVLYTLKNKYNFDLYYRNEKDPSMEISYQDYATNTVVYHFTNIDQNQALGLDFSTNLEFFAWWESSINAELSFVEDKFQGIDGGLYKNSKWNFNGNINNRLTLNKAKEFTAEVNLSYRSPSVQGTFTITGRSNLTLAVRKGMLKGKGQLSLIASDIYKGMREKVSTNYANQSNYYDSYSDNRSIRLGFKYDLGNQKLKNQKSKNQTEEQQRL